MALLFNEVTSDQIEQVFTGNAPLSKISACKSIKEIFSPAITLMAAKEIVETCMRIPQPSEAPAFVQETFDNLYDGARFIAIVNGWGTNVPYRFVKTSSTEGRCLTDGDSHYFESNYPVIRIN